jgi:oligoendopeptidase F
LPKLQHWDRNAPLPDDDDRSIGWTDARERVLAAYGAFSPELAEVGGRFFDRPWIDATLKPGKAGGAFAHPTVPSAHPYLLLNYHGRTRDVISDVFHAADARRDRERVRRDADVPCAA